MAQRLTLVLLLVLGIDIGGAIAVGQEPSAVRSASKIKPPWKPRRLLATNPIATNGKPLRSLVQIDANEHSFAIDTGASATFLSMPGKHRKTVAGRQSLETIAFHEFCFGTMKCDWIKSAYLLDLAHIARGSGTNVTGIVGMDVLARFQVHLDFDHGVMMLIDADSDEVPSGESIPISFSEAGLPYVQLKVGAHRPAMFMIDTGLISCIRVNTADFNLLSKEPAAINTGVILKSHDVYDAITFQEQICYPSISLGKHEVKNVVFADAEQNLIGLPYLCRYRVTLDFKNRKSYWEPSRRFESRDNGDRCGIVYHAQSVGNWTVTSVVPGSLAAAAGITVGDEISAVNGVAASEDADVEWLRELSFPLGDKSITLDVKRGGQALKAVLRDAPR
ncbi:PDZ domain-containing protein [Anatilimnocola sp. NA78]|uniref:PDZ domain-containing protein n=1 Tax=Anatilimnocola sp. NA78 TaxID=3415683 RepID=UPI003CE4A864